MNKNGNEHTLAHTRTRLETNTHLQEWKQTHTCTHMNKNGSEHTLALT